MRKKCVMQRNLHFLRVIARFFEEVGRVGHSLELKVVIRGVLEEHGPLLTALAFKTLVRLNHKLYIILPVKQTFSCLIVVITAWFATLKNQNL